MASYETAPESESKLRYTPAQLVGKGLQRLSYFIESEYVTRRFKNKLKHLGIYDAKCRKTDRQQIFLERKERLYSPHCSNREFKREFVKEFGHIGGLKYLPRYERSNQPLHLGTLHKSRLRFYPNPLLRKKDRSLCSSAPVRWAKRLMKRSFKKLRGENRKLAESGGHGPDQPATNPVARAAPAASTSSRPVVLSSTGEANLIGGQTFPNYGALATRWPDGTFRHFVLIGNTVQFVEHPPSTGSALRGHVGIL